MLDLNIRVEGDKFIVEGLDRLAAEGFQSAIESGLSKVASGIYDAAFKFLSGPGGKGKTTGFVYSDIKTRKLKIKGQKWIPQNVPAGGYPVPVRTGHLLKMLDWLHPGESKTGPVGTFTALPFESVIYDSALYAAVIHEGKGSSEKFGRRRYLVDAFVEFNQGGHVVAIIEEEISKEIEKRGLAG